MLLMLHYCLTNFFTVTATTSESSDMSTLGHTNAPHFGGIRRLFIAASQFRFIHHLRVGARQAQDHFSFLWALLWKIEGVSATTATTATAAISIDILVSEVQHLNNDINYLNSVIDYLESEKRRLFKCLADSGDTESMEDRMGGIIFDLELDLVLQESKWQERFDAMEIAHAHQLQHIHQANCTLRGKVMALEEKIRMLEAE